MSALLWPGDDEAGEVFSDSAVVRAMVEVEAAWLGALVRSGIAPDSGQLALETLVGDGDVAWLAREAAASGTPVAPLVELLRDRLDGHQAATWLHRGLTSQDVLDTALLRCAQDAVRTVRTQLAAHIATLADLVRGHRETPVIARTLTQHAVPTTFGATAAGWLHGLLDAAEDLATLTFPAQLGGAAGTRAALRELASVAGAPDPGATVESVVAHTAATLGLDAVPTWQTTRAPVTRIGDALVRCADAWGHLANDVLVLGRPEIAEVTEGSAGGSSTMPQKANPVLAVLVRRWALNAPAYGAQLHLASGGAVDERPDGAWHAEWQPLQLLARHSVTAATQATTLCAGLQVHPDRMRETLDAALPGAFGERDSMRSLFGAPGPSGTGDSYFAAAACIADLAVERASAAHLGPA